MAEAKYQIRRKCPICGTIFQIRTIDAVYCSHQCSAVAHKRKVDREAKEAMYDRIAKDIPDIREYLTAKEVVAMFAVERGTHDHHEGIKGAQAVALCIFMARNGSTKDEIREKVTSTFGYDLNFTIDGIRETYGWDSDFGNGVLCQASVPQAIVAFLDGHDFEDCVRNAISIGGDSDTIACITGAIAESFYGVPENLKKQVMKYLPDDFKTVISEFEDKYQSRQAKNEPIKSEKVYNLQRFVDAQERDYNTALAEIKSGGTQSHWIWYIFPQQKGIGRRYNARFYGLDGEGEAKAYINHPVLGSRLREITKALLEHKGHRTIHELMGSHIDVIKLRSSMTLFDKVAPNDVFAEVLKEFFPDNDNAL